MERYIQSNKVPRCAHTKSLTLIESPAWFYHQFTSKSIKLAQINHFRVSVWLHPSYLNINAIYVTFWSLAYPVFFGGALNRCYRLRLPAATGWAARLGCAGHDQLPHGKQSHLDAPAEDAGVARWRSVDWWVLAMPKEKKGECPNQWQRITRNMFEVRVDIRVDEDMVLESMVLCF